MLRRRILQLSAAFLLVIGLPAVLVSKTTRAENMVKSDFAQDVEDGQNQVKSDPTAAANQQEVNNNEGEQGEVQNENVDTGEQVDPAESQQSNNTEGSGGASDNSAANSPSGDQSNSSSSGNGQ